MDAPPVLYQFAFSHYNEKVRWALDYKGLPSVRRSLLPGLHRRKVARLSGGPTTTPVLEDGGRAIAGSAAIVAHLEAVAPSPPLFPAEPGLRDEVQGWISWLDDEIGPAVRLALFHELLAEPAYAARMFTTGQPRLAGALYRRVFPRLVPMLRREMRIDAAAAARDRAVVLDGLARVDDASRTTGYLVGGRFTAADLTAGALFFPLFFPPQLGFALPAMHSPALEAWTAGWRDRPGADYVRTLWAKHR